jgi:hypothetical protein
MTERSLSRLRDVVRVAFNRGKAAMAPAVPPRAANVVGTTAPSRHNALGGWPQAAIARAVLDSARLVVLPRQVPNARDGWAVADFAVVPGGVVVGQPVR